MRGAAARRRGATLLWTFLIATPSFLSLLTGSFATPAAENPSGDGRGRVSASRPRPRSVNCDVAPAAAISVRHWTGTDPDAAVLRRTLEELFAG